MIVTAPRASPRLRKGAARWKSAQRERAQGARVGKTVREEQVIAVLHNGYVYGLDEGILTCVDVATGERKWKGGRYGYGQVIMASGHLIVTTETGEIALVKAAPDQHTEVAKFSALEGRTWNNPAISNGRLLVRNATHMACYNLSAL